MNRSAAVKSFMMTNMLLEADLDQIEEYYQIDLGRKIGIGNKIENMYYPQFDASLRAEAKKMTQHYELFYCLEKSIRQLIVDVFEATGEPDWWDNLVPDIVKQNAKKI
ncbi:hypothetical protein [Candidatus Entotheonella palauensis]|uniref:hypothetical protein n=1 Tax=Candidatus Entotheonella palauensis TaxID=93172 RepID=UPI000B7E4B79|nr:hypothetical protein [Candidatus Entotheonella palauensis]